MAAQRGRASAGRGGRPPGGARGQRPNPGFAPRTDLAALRGRLAEVVEPAVAANGYEVEGLTVSRAGRRHLVRVVVDGERGVDSGAIATLARAISSALDDAEAADGDIVAGGYTLEVSSPGVDRPLTEPRHWRRNLGRLVKVKVGERILSARILAVDDGGVTLEGEGDPRRVPYDELGAGRVQVEFNRVDEVADEDLAAFADDDEGVQDA
jgi:ribosome maturation factor RimP